MAGGTHQARVVRRLRGGAYGAWVICDGCPGWERAAWSDDHATALAGQHNCTPNEEKTA
jgi:hypothetical protein